MFLPSLVLSFIAALSIWLLGRRNPARDPRVTGGILVVMLLLPALNFLPKYAIELSSTGEGSAPAFSLIGIWIAGLLIFTLREIANVISMRRWRKESTSIELAQFEKAKAQLDFQGKVELRLHKNLASPVVSGLFRPAIYLPHDADQWPKETLHMALLHELGHLQRKDLWLATAARLTCVFHWFNPLVWWLQKTLLSQCEYACDAHLLNHGADRKTYAHALCDVAESSSTPPLAMAMAGHVPLRQRILQLTEQKRSGSVLLGSLMTLAASSAIAMSLIRFVPPMQEIPDLGYSLEEIELRLTANPFPLD